MKNLFRIALLSFCCLYSIQSFAAYPTVTQHPKVYPFTSVMASPYSCDPTGAVDCAASIELLKANQSNVGTIHIPKGTFKIGTNLTIPVGMRLYFESGAYFSVANGVVLTISGSIFGNEDHEVFTLVGTGSVVYDIGFVYKSSHYISIASALTSIGSTSATLLIDKSASISVDTTFPVTLTVQIERGVVLTIANTKTLTINGSLDAGLYQIFSCTGSGAVVFSSNSIQTLCSVWFGAGGDTPAAIIFAANVAPIWVKADNTAVYRGNLTGNVTGNLTGNVTGNATGLSGTPTLPNGTTATTQTVGDSTTKLATTAFVANAAGVSQKVAVLQNRQTRNTAGGTATQGSWLIVPLNTEQEDASSIVDSTSLPAFTLVAGTYRIESTCPFVNAGGSVGAELTQIRLYNVTDSAVAIVGEGQPINYYGTVFLVGTVTIAATKQFRLEYQVANTQSSNGHGIPCNFAPTASETVAEVYAQLVITKLQ